jgi:hypothetical protein
MQLRSDPDLQHGFESGQNGMDRIHQLCITAQGKILHLHKVQDVLDVE